MAVYQGVSLGTTAAKVFVHRRLTGQLSYGPEDDARAAAILGSDIGTKIRSYPVSDSVGFPYIMVNRYGSPPADIGPLGRGLSSGLT